MNDAVTREQWLNAFTDRLRPLFDALPDAPRLPERIHVSCGWPTSKALSRKSRTIGQCFATSLSQAGVNEIFISPAIDDSVTVAATLVHELIHAADNCKSGHKGIFVKMMVPLGLTGKPTATVPSGELIERLNAVIAELGPYPHTLLDYSQVKKQGTRLIKLTCPECGYVIRTTSKWIESAMPVCRNEHEEREFEQ